VDLDAFVSEHGAEWNRLQVLSSKRRRKLTAAEVDELVVLYRRTATHLSVVRSRSSDPTLVAWLSRLVLQARAAVTPSSGFSVRAVGRFFTVSFPAEIYRAGGWCLGVAVGFLVLCGVLIALVAGDEQIALAFMDEHEIRRLVENDFEAYYSTYAPQNFAGLVWTNNAFISAICLAGGVLILPTVFLLWDNALNVGLVGGVMVGNGRSDVFFGLIAIHGRCRAADRLVLDRPRPPAHPHAGARRDRPLRHRRRARPGRAAVRQRPGGGVRDPACHPDTDQAGCGRDRLARVPCLRDRVWRPGSPAGPDRRR
jgi:hypothetical protein